jgi:DNA-directed RNA polymerase specialized sigma24 family protein
VQAQPQTAFDKLLSRLNADRDQAGELYEELRLKLLKFFLWKNCPDPEACADDALDRLARRLDEGTEIQNVNAYAYQVARFIVLEQLRHPQLEASEEYEPVPPAPPEPRMQCLEDCLTTIAESDRELIIAYYEGEGGEKIRRRKELATALKVTATAIKIRACRIRNKLEKCINGCMEQAE